MRDVSVSFGAKRVLDSVNLDVYRGEILVLLGGSGSGKTTLLKQVLGLTKPNTGSIVINGVDITSCIPRNWPRFAGTSASRFRRRLSSILCRLRRTLLCRCRN